MKFKIEHRLGLQAPPDAIWAVISDINGWGEWNPLYTRAEGVLRIGAQLDLDLALPGQKVRAIRPAIVDWVPNEQILWRLSMMGGLVKTLRYIEIEKLSETGCIFANGELFEGPLGPTVARRMRREIRAGFAAMGEAVKDRVMAMWRPATSDPTC
jgi:hypothetical protein